MAALIAVLGETLADILEPWPIKVVVDSLLQHKKLPGWIGGFVARFFGENQIALLNFAIAAVAAIAVVGAVSSYIEKYLTTSIGQWVTHDLRRTAYNHIQRLSLAEYDEARTGDLITRITSDVASVQDFITSALLGAVVNTRGSRWPGDRLGRSGKGRRSPCSGAAPSHRHGKESGQKSRGPGGRRSAPRQDCQVDGKESDQESGEASRQGSNSRLRCGLGLMRSGRKSLQQD